MKRVSLFLCLAVSLAACSSRPRVEWKYKTDRPVSHSPAIAGEKLIVGSHDHYLYALNLNNGEVIWKKDLGERVLTTPLVEGDQIYAGSASGYFFQVHAKDGSIGWKFQTPGLIEFDPCSDPEGIYFGNYGGGFYKLSRDGRLLWSSKTGNQMSSSCTFYKDLVITTSWDMNIYAFRRDSGETVWKVPTGQYNYANGVIVGDSLYYGTHDKAYRIDAATGKILYKKDAAYHDRIVAFRDHIYTPENGITKRSLDGNVIKNLKFISFPLFQPAVFNNTIVMADTSNHLYGISEDLQILWKFKAKGQFWAPGVLHAGKYYIGNRDGYVYALKLPA